MRIFQFLNRPNYSRVEHDLKKNIKSGKIIQFNVEFYSLFDGMYFNGLPIYYYLERMNMGKCYDTSAILGLALGDCKICRGVLNNVPSSDGKKFGHGWVEKDGLVYDTTWKIITDIETYYKIFGVGKLERRDSQQFFQDNKEITTWEIHNKKYYEENYIPLINILIFTTQQLELTILENPSASKNEKEIAIKTLRDLPQISLSATSEWIDSQLEEKQPMI